jgi:hypothetical protein
MDGMPLTSPVDEIVSPGGWLPAKLQKYGAKPPVAENWRPAPPAPYCVPTTPFGAELGPVSTSAAPGVVVIVQVRLGDTCPATSVTVTVKVCVPACAAWPLSTPVDGFNVRLNGKGLLLLQRKGAAPVAVNVMLTVAPSANVPSWQVVPERVPGHCTVGGVGLLTVIVNCDDTAVFGGLCESCTCTTNVKVPDARGVPEIPPDLASVMPEGN